MYNDAFYSLQKRMYKTSTMEQLLGGAYIALRNLITGGIAEHSGRAEEPLYRFYKLL